MYHIGPLYIGSLEVKPVHIIPYCTMSFEIQLPCTCLSHLGGDLRALISTKTITTLGLLIVKDTS
jgi:hypothetical protein